MAQPQVVVWQPQRGPQKALIDCPFPLIGFGGARGGGKTDGVLGKYALKGQRYGRNFNAVFFRKELPQADDLIERAKEIYGGIGATYRKQERTFILKEGGRIRFRALESTDDAEKYQGQNVTDAAIEEAGNYSDPAPIDRLFGCLRSKAGVPTQMILTFNPGGSGHYWLKERFVKPAPHGNTLLEWKLPTGRKFHYVYIPSRVQDNKILMLNDPTYVDRLHLVGSPELVRAWLEGDFEIHVGSYFPEFSSRHIIQPFPIPQHWPKYVGFDWGYNSPFCAVWGAVSSGKDDSGREVPYPKGALVIYRELWGKGIDNGDIARRMLELSGDEDPHWVADPSIFSHEGGPSIADQFRSQGLAFRPADNDRLSGWSQIRMRLKPDPAMLYLFSTCPYLIETLPGLAMDPKKPEDVDTTGEDHGGDALRYLCKERLLEATLEIKKDPIHKGRVNVSKFVEQMRREMARSRV